MQGRIRDADPDAFDDIPDFAFDNSCPDPSTNLELLWSSICDIYEAAQRCHDRRKDENAWARIIWKVLELGIQEAKSVRLEV